MTPLGPLQLALLSDLADVPGGLTSAVLAPCVTAPGTQQRRQATVNTVLNRLWVRGLVDRSERKVPARRSAYLWQITEAGRRALPPLDGES
jgi:hypothetical protein